MNDSDILESLSREVDACSRAARPLNIVGGNTKRFHGGVVEGDVLAMNHFAGVLEYEPTELVITARAWVRWVCANVKARTCRSRALKAPLS